MIDVGGDNVILKGEFSADDVHKHCAMAFTTPALFEQNITEPMKVRDCKILIC